MILYCEGRHLVTVIREMLQISVRQPKRKKSGCKKPWLHRFNH